MTFPKGSDEQRRPSCLGVITARGGSKSVPGKNLRLLDGRPAIAHAIEAGLCCRYMDKVAVTTDSEAIADCARAEGAEVPFLRPADLATDEARQEDAISHLMDFYEAGGERYDLVCLLEPTIPFRKVSSLEAGFELLFDHPEAAGVISITKSEFSPLRCNTLRPDGTLKGFIDPAYRMANRQELPDFYRISTVVVIVRWDAFRANPGFVHDTTLGVVVDPVEAIDMDEPLDVFLVESLLASGLSTSADVRRHVLGGGGRGSV